MIQEKIELIISKLEEKTKENKAIWELTPNGDQYLLRFNVGSIVIGRNNDPFTESVNELIILAIYNSNGDRIYQFLLDKKDDSYTKLFNLFHSIENKFYQRDETIDSILSELESDKIIGSDDDIPF